MVPLLVAAVSTPAFATLAFDLAVEFEVVPAPAAKGLPVFVQATIRNHGADPVVVVLGPYREAAFDFFLVDESGEILEGTWRIRGGPTSLMPRVFVKPGGSFQQALILNRWHAVELEGELEVFAYLDAAVLTGGEPPFFLDSTPVGRFTGHGRLELLVVDDGDAASAFCEALAENAKLRDTDVALPAMEALTFVRTPACIPALIDVLMSSFRSPHQELPRALAEIGGRAAAEALAELADGGAAKESPMILYFLDGFCDEYEQIVSPALLRARGRGCH